MDIGDVKHEFNIDRSPFSPASANTVCSIDTPAKSSHESNLDALEAFLEGTGGKEEVVSWKSTCDEVFDLNRELLESDEFVQVANFLKAFGAFKSQAFHPFNHLEDPVEHQGKDCRRWHDQVAH
ncbi:unnamed protein product [Amaranthus hypochondriacus]